LTAISKLARLQITPLHARVKAFWIKGIYTHILTDAKNKYYGGIVRSENVLEIISQNINLEGIIPVTIRHPFKQPNTEKNILESSFTYKSLIIRLIYKILRSINIDSPTLRYGSLECKAEDLKKYIDKGDLIILDSIAGYVMIKPQLHNLVDFKIIYLSHNFEPNFFGVTNPKHFIWKSEKEAVNLADLVIVASYRDLLLYNKYYECPIEKIAVLPNIYPLNFNICKEDSPTVAVILGDHWGKSVIYSLANILSGLKNLNLKIISVGNLLTKKLKHMGLNVEGYDYILGRRNFLEIISKAQIGINYGINLGGTNVRKFDYALSALVVLSSPLGSRGEPLPYEYTFTDAEDLKTKLRFLLERDLKRMGEENRRFALSYFNSCIKDLAKKLRRLTSQ